MTVGTLVCEIASTLTSKALVITVRDAEKVASVITRTIAMTLSVDGSLLIEGLHISK